tara:strand:+ start:196 stop:1707 length:1512 start_codon:yes stop_codon:yes gene_type:complete
VTTQISPHNTLLAFLQDWKWRLNNLYTFVDWDGEKRIFTMNKAQEMLFDEMHQKNIILKARQWGITTYKIIFMLDAILWRPDIRCLFVAHTREDAGKIFESKVRYAYDNLPSWVKEHRPILKANAGELKVDHGNSSWSSLEVGTSGRGGTYEYIHISELGKIAARDPLKAGELISGTLNAGANAKITIESTAEGDHGVFFDMCTKAELDKLTGKKLNRLDYKFFFLSWIGHPNYVFSDQETAEEPITQETRSYFKDFDATENEIAWYQAKKKEQGDKMPQEFPTTPEEAFSKPMEGAFYAKHVRAMLEAGRIGEVEWDPEHPVFTYCDIGHSDYTVNLYVQYIGRDIRIFDSYVGDSKHENNDMKDMIDDMRSKPYKYAAHIAPHDMNVFEWGIGMTRKQQALDNFGVLFELADKKVSREDGIEAVKHLFPRFVLNKDRCGRILSGMRAYRREMNADGSFSNRPNHDGSDFVDPLRYLAVTQNLTTNDMVLSATDNIETGGCL